MDMLIILCPSSNTIQVMILEKSGDGWWRGQYGNKVASHPIRWSALAKTNPEVFFKSMQLPGWVVPIKLHARGNWRSAHLLYGWERPRRHGETFLCNQMQSGIIAYGLFWQKNKLLSFCRWLCMHSRRRRTPNWASAKATVLRWQDLFSPNNWSLNNFEVARALFS